MNRRRRFFAAGAILLGLCTAILIAEVFVRAFDLAPGLNRISTEIHRLSNDPDLKYELVPEAFEGYEAINSMGRRDFSYRLKKEPGTFRIAVLGDSVAFGWGVNVWQSHPSMIEYYLNQFQTDPKTTFEVWNFGVRGYGSDEEAACLKRKVVPIDPDLVLLSYSLNDPDPFSVDLAWVLSKIQWTDEQYLNGATRARSNPVRRFFYERVRLFRLLRYRWLSAKQARQKKQADNLAGKTLVKQERDLNYEDKKHRYFIEATQNHWPTIERAFAEMGAVSRENGFPLVVAILPGLDDLENYRYESIHRKVAAQAEKSGLIPIDLLPAFLEANSRDSKKNPAIDFQHPNSYGHRIAGQAISIGLIQAGLLPMGSSAFDAELYEPETPAHQPDLSAFSSQLMFQVEAALNGILMKDYPAAIEALEKAVQIEPSSHLTQKVLKKLAKVAVEPGTKARIEAIRSR
jgi:GDSL-like lipase/acylhydrolase family protein